MSEAFSFSMFTIYENPADFPGKFLVRQWSIWPGEDFPRPNVQPKAVAETLDEARASIPKGMVCLNRFDEDDPCIVESWI